ncbi:MAG TPA: hypothetical protein VM260_08565 [Pirellula sp.]|nr:hypothetical protein [Pirellula sp.]
MNKFWVALFVCVGSVSTRALADNPSAEFVSYTGNDLFPSYIIATTTVDWNGDEQRAEDKKTAEDPELEDDETPIFGDENGSIGIELRDVPDGAKIEVEMIGEGFLKKSKWKGEIDEEYEVLQVFPKANWDYAALRKCTQQKPANLKIKVTIDGDVVSEIDETVQLRSINDCPFYVVLDDNGDDIEDISVTFAAYVNENHPWIDGILKEALTSAKEPGLINSFTGYQSGSADEVISQVFAVWNALQRRGIKYSDVSTTLPSKFVYSQTVRFLDDSVQASQANCVDGSVLMASILRRIGLDAYLVMVPGHCFLGFSDGNEESKTMFFLETTMLGSDNLKSVADLPNLPDKLKQDEFAASYRTFVAALEQGKSTYLDNEAAFDSEEDPETQLISISEARDLGVMPIGALPLN